MSDKTKLARHSEQQPFLAKPRTDAWRAAMRCVAIAWLAFFALHNVSCKDGPVVSGKPASYWVEKLNDLDPMQQIQALEALQYCDARTLRPARSRLHEIAAMGLGYSTDAAVILHQKFGEVSPSYADTYLRPKKMTHGISYLGAEAVKSLAETHPEVALAAIQRRLAEATDHDDITLLQRLRQEVDSMRVNAPRR